MAKKWYIAQVYTNFEKKVADALMERVALEGMEHLIDEILVPTEEVVSIRRGKRVVTERRLFPGYIMIHMEMTDASWNLVNSTPKAVALMGNKGLKPTAISDAEANRILQQAKDGADSPRPSIEFIAGDQVRVCDGPFASFNGVVEEVDHERSRLKVIVSIFSRATPVDLEYGQVEKL